MAHVHPARLDADAFADARAERELRLEEDPTPEGDLVGAEEMAGRTSVDREAKTGTKIPVGAKRESRRDPDSPVIGLSSRVQRCKHIGLKLAFPDSGDTAAAVADHDVGSFFDPAKVGRKLHIVDIESAEDLAGVRR